MRFFSWPEGIAALLYGLVIVTPFWKIFGKAGFSKWWALFMAIPLVNLILLYYVAFARWPAQRAPGPLDGGHRDGSGLPPGL